jgi:PAS domain S-box-containing protein
MNEPPRRRKDAGPAADGARLADIVDDAVVGTDADFRVTVWNRAAERLYGYAASEVLGRDAREVASYPGDTSWLELEHELLDTDRTRTEITAYRKDGTPIRVELVAVALRDAAGAVTGYVGIHRDMTERRRAEEALEAAHRRATTILERIGDSFLAVDRDWRYTDVNDRLLRRLEAWQGRTVAREEVLGRGVWELFPGLVGTEVEKRLRAAMGAADPAEFELYFAPTGEWVEARAFPSPDGMSLYFRTITERKRAADALERAARRQGVIAKLGVRALAADGLDALLDDAALVCAEMLDVELVGIHEVRTGSGDLVLRAGTGWRQGADSTASPARTGSPMGFAVMTGAPATSADLRGDERFEISPLLSDQGAVSGLCVVIDGSEAPFGVLGAFTPRPRAFSETDVDFAQAIANVLASAVERTRNEERLIEVKEVERRRIARDLHDEALQDLSLAIAGAMAARAGDDMRGDIVPVLERVGLHVRGAIHDLRLGGQQNRAFRELLDELVAMQRELPGGSEIVLQISDDVPTGVLGRRGIEILRIVGEALVNARRHAGARIIRIDASIAGGLLRIDVADDGHGFDAHAPPDAGGGTGILGMRERAELLGAGLAIASGPTGGTRIRLDVRVTAARAAGPPHARILLVEDHAAVREALAAMFEREDDFTVVGEASSLAEARDRLDGVDVAVVDIGLPDGDGTDLIDDLVAANAGAQTLVLSAGIDRERTARAIERGAAAALDKTVHLNEVVDAVRRLRAGETLLPAEEVVALMRLAGRRRDEESLARAGLERLTTREREVLQALGAGLDTHAIAQRLDITVRTARNHVANILAKLGVHTQLQAVLLGLRYGAIELG